MNLSKVLYLSSGFNLVTVLQQAYKSLQPNNYPYKIKKHMQHPTSLMH